MFRKIHVIAAREYLAVVRSKAFILSLLVLPLMMGASIGIQRVANKVQDLNDKSFVVIDNTPGEIALQELRKLVDERNASVTRSGAQLEPKFRIETAQASADLTQQRFDLSERIRRGELIAFVEIGGNITTGPADGSKDENLIRWQTNSPTWFGVRQMVHRAVNLAARKQRLEALGVPPDKSVQAMSEVLIVDRGLTRRDDAGQLTENEAQRDQLASVFIPLGLAMLMWMTVVIGAMPLMQGIVEEKQQRIAEVLLGSVKPFELMMGKVLGLAGTSVTLIIVYLGGAYWGLHQMGLGDRLTLTVIGWFLVFQILAVLMYGSLYIAIGASCTDTKEIQSLIMPVNLVLALPIILVFSVAQNPAGPLARPLTFFPPATPIITVVRMSVPPGIPLWETLLAVVLVVLTTLLLVWMSGRIFRIGILVQSKGASLKQLFQWALRG